MGACARNRRPRPTLWLISILLAFANAGCPTGTDGVDQADDNENGTGQPAPPDEGPGTVSVDGNGVVEITIDGSRVTLTALPEEHVPNVVEKERFSPGAGHSGRLREVNSPTKGEPQCRELTRSERGNRAGVRLGWSKKLTC